MRQGQRGFSLIELVVFIVVISFAITGIFFAFSTSLQKSPAANTQSIANKLAQARMEIIIGQRNMNGFNSFADPCSSGSPPAICTLPAALSSYSITSTISTVTINSDSNYKLINVAVSGPQSAYANLKTWVAFY